MWKYISKRIFWAIVYALAAVIIIFAIFHLVRNNVGIIVPA